MTKYHAIKTQLDGFTFDSKAEAYRYQTLKILEHNGDISGLSIHPKYRLEVNGQFIASYIADFEYVENEKLIIEDVKGVKTPVYRLKKKLMQALYGTIILETS